MEQLIIWNRRHWVREPGWQRDRQAGGQTGSHLVLWVQYWPNTLLPAWRHQHYVSLCVCVSASGVTETGHLSENTVCARAYECVIDLGGAREVETQSCCIFSQTAKSMQSGFEWKECVRVSEPAGSPRRQSAVGHYSSSVSTTTINDNVVVAVATNTLVPLHLHLEGGREEERGRGEEKGKTGEGRVWRLSVCDISTKLWHAVQSGRWGVWNHYTRPNNALWCFHGWTVPSFIIVIGASACVGGGGEMGIRKRGGGEVAWATFPLTSPSWCWMTLQNSHISWSGHDFVWLQYSGSNVRLHFKRGGSNHDET